ncbi:hypothetical protein [Streptomyces sp. SudanB66_2053]|uniref:hypothetical protein n=1 Tax=Streptomyces sp. SudanB66_2053 TaxID=3035277 RepID=UPI003F556E5E
MPRSTRKKSTATRLLIKVPRRIGAIDTAALIGRLRHLHEEAEDQNLDRMPADEELFGSLLYLEANAGALKSQEARCEAAKTRVLLWEYLREQTDLHQVKAVDDARAAGTEWAGLASALAVNAPNAAYNKARRMKAAVLAVASCENVSVRRTPEAVREAERQAVTRLAADRRAEEEAARRYSLLAPVASRLVEHRDGLDDDDEITFWLDQIEALLPSCRTPTQLVSLDTYVQALVREAHRSERTAGRAAATTVGARAALAAARGLVAG